MKKVTKIIRIDADKCSGCRACEVICSAYHAEPQYSIVNQKRSRIRIFRDEENDLYVPILAGAYTDVECNGHTATIIKGKEYGDCSFCRQSCPSRDLFKEPDSGLPLKCDMCGEPMPEGGIPMCVKWCLTDALLYVERTEDDETGEVTERVLGKTEPAEVLATVAGVGRGAASE
ncbi:MAG: (4Fe-4S)-binding protein [Chloroflexi bacterium]|nr:(4Fe-4S)-binding protein [Chloroflexota bacterium]